VLWSKQRPLDSGDSFDWRIAAYILNVPMIRALFEQLVMPSRVGALGLDEVLDRTAGVLNRVDRVAFFENFDEEGAVQYFYEPFLEAFDPELRKQFGVWYTPAEVVRYMVERVDTVLRSELGIEDGLADENVYVLDPCTGTGSYLVEVLKRIRETLTVRGEDALLAQDLKKAATERIFGFELLPAPFVVAHLQLGLLLQNMGAPLAGTGGERAGVYLTNALTGWEPSEGAKQRLPLPEFEEERDAAEEVKRRRPILVILGNPPYNGFADVGMEEERSLSAAYRTTKNAPRPEGQGLNDLYVRFFRMAERQIVEGTGRGVVSFISNYSWLDGLSYPGMRERYLEAFDEVWIDSLNGDAYKTGKRTPEDEPDPSIFSTRSNPAGIAIGTAIATLVRRSSEEHKGAGKVHYRDLWGRAKRERLLESAHQGLSDGLYDEVEPELALGLPFASLQMAEDYAMWSPLPDLFGFFAPGVKTSRDLDLVAIDQEGLVERMGVYFDRDASHAEVRELAPSLMKRSGRFDPAETRSRLLRRGMGSGSIVRYAYRPFDDRWVYWHSETKLLDERREELFRVFEAGNLFMTSRHKAERSREGTPFYATANLPDWHLTRPGSACFPLRATGLAAEDLFSNHEISAVGEANLSRAARDYLDDLGVSGTRAVPEEAGAVWMHALAVGYSPAYLSENVGGLWIGWPRMPLPGDEEMLLASAALGGRVVGLLGADGYADGAGVQSPRGLGSVWRRDGGMLDPGRGDLAVTAGWGYAGTGGIAMPGGGELTSRAYSPEERRGIEEAAQSFNLKLSEALELLGERTLDVHLNGVAYWSGVPENVWSYTVGGYQVLKKWLSYREKKLLGRDLRPEEAREFSATVGRIAALLLLAPRLDENYRKVASAATRLSG
jgi:predicted helicase